MLTLIFAGPNSFAEHARDEVQGTLGRRVDQRVRRRVHTRDGTDIDNTAALRPELLDRFLNR